MMMLVRMCKSDPMPVAGEIRKTDGVHMPSAECVTESYEAQQMCAS